MNTHQFNEIDLNLAKELTKEKVVLIGKNIKKLRKRNKLTQSDVAFYIFSDKSLISALERGVNTNINLESIQKIAVLFDVSIISLFEHL